MSINQVKSAVYRALCDRYPQERFDNYGSKLGTGAHMLSNNIQISWLLDTLAIKVWNRGTSRAPATIQLADPDSMEQLFQAIDDIILPILS